MSESIASRTRSKNKDNFTMCEILSEKKGVNLRKKYDVAIDQWENEGGSIMQVFHDKDSIDSILKKMGYRRCNQVWEKIT